MTEPLNNNNGHVRGFPSGSVVKNPPAIQETWRHGFDPWVGKTLWRREEQLILVFLPGESHEQRSLVRYNSQGCKELHMTELLAHIHRAAILK